MAAHQETTCNLWSYLTDEYETYISVMVWEESRKGDPHQAKMRLAAIESFPTLEIDEETKFLADKIIAGKGMPPEYPEDALHIAVAAVNDMDVLVTWNFAHLNNPFTRRKVRKIFENEGYCAPRSVHLKNCWSLTNERPDRGRSAQASNGAYTETLRLS